MSAKADTSGQTENPAACTSADAAPYTLTMELLTVPSWFGGRESGGPDHRGDTCDRLRPSGGASFHVLTTRATRYTVLTT